MKQDILFIQGGGDDGYLADQPMVNNLRALLGDSYEIAYPELISDQKAPDFGWAKQISRLISEAKQDVIIVAHSFGASMILKFLSEHVAKHKIKAVLLLAPPFWEGEEEWKKAFMLKEDFGTHLPPETSFFFYHNNDDDVVPSSHFERYRQHLHQAKFYKANLGGHQFTQHLEQVAHDIRSV